MHESLIQQIKGCTDFFVSQQQILGVDSLKESMGAMARSISSQIANLPALDVTAAAQLNAAIEASGFGVSEKQTLCKGVSNRTTTSVAISPQRRGTQTLANVSTYFTQQDWNILQDATKPIDTKLFKVVDRLALLGMRNPSESTTKSLVAVIAASHFDDTVDASALHALVVHLKNALGSRRSVAPKLL